MPAFVLEYLRLYREALSGLPRATWLLAAITFVHRAGQMVLVFLTIYFREALGFDESAIVWLLACYGVGNAIGAYGGGWLCDRVHPARVQTLALLLNGIALLVLPAIHSLDVLCSLLLAVGVTGTAFRPAATTLLVSTCPKAKRAQAFAFFRLAINLGVAAGPAFGGIIASYDFDWLFYVEGGACVLTALLVGAFLRGAMVESVDEDVDNDAPARSPWGDRLFLLLVVNTGTLAFVVIQWFSAGTLFLTDAYGMDTRMIGFLFAMNPVIIVVIEMVLVQRLRNHAKLPWIARSGWLVAASCFVLLLGDVWPLAVLSVLLWTFAEMIESPLTGALVADRAGPANRGQYMGIYTLSYSLAHGIAPAFSVWVYHAHGAAALWGVAGAMAGISAICVGIAARRHSD